MSTSMLAELARQTGGQVPTLVADICHLALASDAFDATVAAFVLNHLDRPADGVRELVRVTRPGGRVVATTFGADDHPMKPAVDDVLTRHGYEHPPWSTSFKRSRIPLTASVDAFTDVGREGGLAEAKVDAIAVDLGDLPLGATIAYRLGMAHIAPFIATLAPDRRSAIEAEITTAIEHLPPLQLPMLVLSGHGS
jgi:SAM-dependent methyltransferase